jgi:hypothetical protein
MQENKMFMGLDFEFVESRPNKYEYSKSHQICGLRCFSVKPGQRDRLFRNVAFGK